MVQLKISSDDFANDSVWFKKVQPYLFVAIQKATLYFKNKAALQYRSSQACCVVYYSKELVHHLANVVSCLSQTLRNASPTVTNEYNALLCRTIIRWSRKWQRAFYSLCSCTSARWSGLPRRSVSCWTSCDVQKSNEKPGVIPELYAPRVSGDTCLWTDIYPKLMSINPSPSHWCHMVIIAEVRTITLFHC